MLRLLLCLALAGPFLTGCTGLSESKTATALTPEAELGRITREFIAAFLDWHPAAGTSLGLHEYDGRVTDLSRASIKDRISGLEQSQHRLERLERKTLPAGAVIEAGLLRCAIENELFSLRDLGSPWHDPLTYAGLIEVDIYMKRDFAPREARLKSVMAILAQAPRLMADARANLVRRLPRPHTETAIEVAGGAADFLEKDLAEAFKDLESPEFRACREVAVRELRGYADWLKREKLPLATDDFALGRKRYIQMLRGGELIDLTPEQLLAIGHRELRRVQAEFAATARRIDPFQSARQVYAAIQKDHPTARNLIPESAASLESIRQFLVDKHILTIPSEVRAKVMESPQFMRATSFASMDTPGPFETRATEAYYYITPVEAHWPEKQQEEWLTAFNYYTTDVMSIHEAYPGHYVQYLCLNASKAGKLAKMFPSYAFSEGWAHYSEEMMLQEGFGQSDPKRADKYRLAQLGEALLRLCRMNASLQMHCQGMTVAGATKFFQDNAYYEEKPARAEATRGAYDPGYLYYTVGKLQIFKLREDWKRQEGSAYSLQRFHDELLAAGAPPIRLVRQRMLKDPASWDKVF